MLVGGWMQGSQALNPDIPYEVVAQGTLPALWGRSMGIVTITLGNLGFARLLFRQLIPARPRPELDLPESVRAALAE